MCGSAPPVSCSCGISWRQLAGVRSMHTRVKNRNNQPVRRRHRSTTQPWRFVDEGSNAAHASPLKFSYLSLTVFRSLQQQKQHLRRCIGGGLLVSAACTQELCLKTINRCDDGVDGRRNKSLMVLVAAMTQRSEQRHPCHSADVFMSLFDRFAFAPATKTTFAAPPASCIGGGLLASAACTQELCLKTINRHGSVFP